VDSQALRELEAEERRQTGGGPAWRTRGTRNDIDLPDDDLVSVGGEDSLSRCACARACVRGVWR